MAVLKLSKLFNLAKSKGPLKTNDEGQHAYKIVNNVKNVKYSHGNDGDSHL